MYIEYIDNLDISKLLSHSKAGFLIGACFMDLVKNLALVWLPLTENNTTSMRSSDNDKGIWNLHHSNMFVIPEHSTKP